MKFITATILLVLLPFSVFCQEVKYINTQNAKEDFDFLIRTFEEVHYNPYFLHSKDTVFSFKEAKFNDWLQDSIPVRQFLADGMELTSMMSGGHSYMYWNVPSIINEIRAHEFLPISGHFAKNQEYFVVDRSQLEEIDVGDTLHSINGIPAADLFHKTMSLIAGIEAFRAAKCETMFPFYLFFCKELNSPYELKTSKSSLVKTRGVSLNEIADFVNEKAVPENYTFAILEDSVGLISYNRCQNYKAFKKFLKKTFSEIESKSIDKLIIDIRENGGGDSSLNDLLLSYITEKPYRQSSGRYWKVSQNAKDAYSSASVYTRIFGKKFMNAYMSEPNGSVIEELDGNLQQPIKSAPFFEGKTCFLIGPETFSSANFLADAIKTYELSTLIGEPTGEYTNDFGEQIKFVLPNSKASVFVSSTYDIGASGDASALHPVRPDILLEEQVLGYAKEWIKQ